MDEPTIQQRVLAEVAAERQRQDERWGVSDHAPDLWALLVAEHAGRLAADALDFGDVAGEAGKSHLALLAFRERCVKVAAICVAAVEGIDRANANRAAGRALCPRQRSSSPLARVAPPG